MIPDPTKIKQGEKQDRNVFNAYKRIVRDMHLLTDEQIASIHFESWNEAFTRSGKRINEELLKLDAV